MAFTEIVTRTIRIALDESGTIQTIQTQTLTEVSRDEDLISREAGPAEQIDAETLAKLLIPEDRARLAKALNT